ncbi:hypothetical protein GYMLUDRAFT_260557 [Collybiopsis luxurians FD-317 M1]|uniref:Uncharacterized protein n=1 Tax=Collybiopsis luxurians FD-317 M1 TaxID=944289 RepID=A0A0D0C1U6_9AGAR|nr:hypothetical protein GYMLUDRAFT_260557 [Collybiopsis luxurians FD-317 M1]
MNDPQLLHVRSLPCPSFGETGSERFGHSSQPYQAPHLGSQGGGFDISSESEAPHHVNLRVQNSTLYDPGAFYPASPNSTGQYYDGVQGLWPSNVVVPEMNLRQLNIDTYSQASYRADLHPYYLPVNQSAIQDMALRMNMSTQVSGNAQLPPAHFHLPFFDDRRNYQGTAGSSWSSPPQQAYQSAIESALMQKETHIQKAIGYTQPSSAHHALEKFSARSRSSICRLLKDDGTECEFLMNEHNVDVHLRGHLPKARSDNKRVFRVSCMWKLETGKQCGSAFNDARVLFRHIHTHHEIKVICPYPLCEKHLSRGRQDIIWRHLENVHGLPKHPRRKTVRQFYDDRFSLGYYKKQPLTWEDIRDSYGENSKEWRDIEREIEGKLSAGTNVYIRN